ncbi:hypothetical protein ACFLS4_02750 [Bacteroidota bacterium]
MKKTLIILFSLIFVLPFFIGCEEDDTPTAPDLPPYGSMAIDFSNFTVNSKSLNDLNKLFAEGDFKTSTNYEFAAGHVGFWSLLLTVTLAVPVASFYASFQHTPTYLGNNKWQWTYDVTGFATTHTARLTGMLRTSDIKWEMYITRTGVGAYPEFKWFEGISNLDDNSGQWILYHSYDFQDELLQIDWTKSGDDIGEITYTYVRELDNNNETDLFNGSYITYGLQSDYFDAYYFIHFYNIWTSQFVDIDIEWSTTEYYGHVKAEHKFGDTDWHCWDDYGVDIDCTN